MRHGRPQELERGHDTDRNAKNQALKASFVRSFFATGAAVRLFSLIALLMIAVGTARSEPSGERADFAIPPLANDAELFDVFFLNATHGWAVGQHGVIWHTGDGGDRWTLQHYVLGLRLESVWFVDDHTGWAVGCEPRPFPTPFSGVLLRTADGGRHWQREPKLLIPPLSRVKFFTPHQGIAIGANSLVYPSGVLVTDDGGQTWSPVILDDCPVVKLGEYRQIRQGIVCGERGQLRSVRGRETASAEMPGVGLRRIRDLKIGGGAAWAVGEGGLIFRSADSGAAWQDLAPQLPHEPSGFDWATIATHGSNVWIAGSPGNCVAHSSDQGASWQLLATGQSLPINRIFFSDPSHGWTVGALGTIRRTNDGGKHWETVHAGGDHAAWLAIYSEPQAVPAELVARLAAADGYLGVIRSVVRRDLVAWPGTEAQLALRSGQMLAMLGAARSEYSWRFPVRERGVRIPIDQVCDDWSRLGIADARQALEQELVRTILVWRPEVIFTHAATSADPLEKLIYEVVLKAVERTANHSLPEDGTAPSRLKPWQPKKIYMTAANKAGGDISIIPSEVPPGLATSLRDYTIFPSSLVAPHSASPPSAIACKLVGSSSDSMGQRDFFTGISVPDGQARRRRNGEKEEISLEHLRAVQQAQRIEPMLEASLTRPGSRQAIIAQIDSLIAGLTPEHGVVVLQKLADGCRQTGRIELGADVYGLLAKRFPEHPFAPLALMRLIHIRSSGEASHGFGSSDALSAPSREPVAKASSDGIAQAAASEPVPKVAGTQDPLAQAVAAGQWLEQVDSALYSEPLVRFPLAAASRKSQSGQAPVSSLITLVAGVEQFKAWQTNAAAEVWQAEHKGVCPKQVLHCGRATERPHLDGRLDDAAWHDLIGLDLKSPYRDDSDWPTVVRLSYDEQFLFIAAVCHSPTSRVIRKAPTTRKHDAASLENDRLELYIDLDRDYCTYYQFVVDERGFTADACLEDATFNPTWFVAQAEDEKSWTIEAAIPWESLCDSAPERGESWAVGIQRVLPSRGFQSATAPAAPYVQPEGFGWLQFE